MIHDPSSKCEVLCRAGDSSSKSQVILVIHDICILWSDWHGDVGKMGLRLWNTPSLIVFIRVISSLWLELMNVLKRLHSCDTPQALTQRLHVIEVTVALWRLHGWSRVFMGASEDLNLCKLKLSRLHTMMLRILTGQYWHELAVGVFRSNWLTRFKCCPAGCDGLQAHRLLWSHLCCTLDE